MVSYAQSKLRKYNFTNKFSGTRVVYNFGITCILDVINILNLV